jgi:quercetin dioxygenase-like cupin family protein
MKLEVLRWRGAAAPGEAQLRATLVAEGYDVLSWSDPAGTTYEPHTHQHDESLWLVSGEMTFGIAGQSYALRAGDRLLLPRGTVHSAVAGVAGASYLVGQRR